MASEPTVNTALGKAIKKYSFLVGKLSLSTKLELYQAIYSMENLENQELLTDEILDLGVAVCADSDFQDYVKSQMPKIEFKIETPKGDVFKKISGDTTAAHLIQALKEDLSLGDNDLLELVQHGQVIKSDQRLGGLSDRTILLAATGRSV